MDLLCGGPHETVRYRYIFTDFDRIDDVVKRAVKVGFAFPLENDQFIIVRFDLIGSNEAIDAMRASAERSSQLPARQGTRDQRL
jgi:hypothetical protein